MARVFLFYVDGCCVGFNNDGKQANRAATLLPYNETHGMSVSDIYKCVNKAYTHGNRHQHTSTA